jgi:hypothetical protein
MTARRKLKTEPAEPEKKGGQSWRRREVDLTSPAAQGGAAVAAGAEPAPRASSRLCEEISCLSGGTCFLGFSRGKDSIAAWLQLRKYFTRIIPFHCASVPHLGFVDESLAYYERVFGTEIIRLMDGACIKAVNKLFWQPPGSEEEVIALVEWWYDKHDQIKALQRDLHLPNAWCAFGINMTDSLDRRIWVEKIGGKNPQHMTFYPCFDWKKSEIIDAIQAAGILLPKDYLRVNRSMAGLPAYRHMAHMREWAPDDYDRVLSMYPMLEAELARQEFRRAKHPAKGRGTPTATAALGMVSARAIA